MTLVLISGGIDISVGSVAALTGVVTSELLLWTGAALPLWAGRHPGIACGVLAGRSQRAAGHAAQDQPADHHAGYLFHCAWAGLCHQRRADQPAQRRRLQVPRARQHRRHPFFADPDGRSFTLLLLVILHYNSFGRNPVCHRRQPGGGAPGRHRVNRTPAARLRHQRPVGGSGGIIIRPQLGSSAPRAAVGLEFTVIAAVVLGGTSLSGGKGTLFGTLIGVLHPAHSGQRPGACSTFPPFTRTWRAAWSCCFAVGFDQVRQRFGRGNERHAR